MNGTASIRSGYGAWRRSALALIFVLVATPALAFNIDSAKQPYDLGHVTVGNSSNDSALVGISGRGTADSDPASLGSHAGEVSDKADTAQSIYCKEKGGVVWYAANLLSALARKPNDSYHVEAMSCP